MATDASHTSRQQIATWATPETKDQFRALAATRGLSESRMLALLIDSVLARNPSDARLEGARPYFGDRDRISIRLRPGDGNLLRARAGERGMNYTTYAAALIRAHMRASPPMPMHEVAMLERALGEISAIARAMRQIAFGVGKAQAVDSQLESEFVTVLQTVEDLRQAVRDLVRANVISWESIDA